MVKRDEHGFLSDAKVWSPAVAEMLALEEHLILTDAHWLVIHFLRSQYFEFKITPPSRLIIKELKTLDPAHNSQSLKHLFPAHDGPIRQACKIAGLPRPVKCI